jgi:hypothetical protein
MQLRYPIRRYPNLADSYLKTARAKKHLENLRSEVKAFCESKPYKFVREDDLDNGVHIVRMQVAETPDEITLIAGDLFNCLRASLDQLVWSLAKLTGVPYPKNTQFPILDKPNPQKFSRRTEGVPAAALSIIESLQPYNAADPSDPSEMARIRSHLLWKLDKLCNIDKHMRIPVHGTTGVILWKGVVGRDVLFDDEGVVRVPIARKNEVALDPNVTFTVVFGDLYWGVDCDFDGIERIYEFVANRVIPRFARFFK